MLKERAMFRTKRTVLQTVVPVALLSTGIAYWFALRPWHIRWGATDEEIRQPLPGDGIVQHPRSGEYTS